MKSSRSPGRKRLHANATTPDTTMRRKVSVRSHAETEISEDAPNTHMANYRMIDRDNQTLDTSGS